MADSTPLGPGIAFGRIASAIPVSDISRAVGFYQGVLGMSPVFTNGDPIGFVILERDEAELHLTSSRVTRPAVTTSRTSWWQTRLTSMIIWWRTASASSRGCVTPTTGSAASSSPTLTVTAST